MIPDELIEKAKSAYINRCGKVCSHASLVAALEAVAADIWDEGWSQGMAYVVGMERGIDDDHATTNPYRTQETA